MRMLLHQVKMERKKSLPSGPKPTIFILDKEVEELSDNELKILEIEVLEKISGQEKRFSVLCVTNYKKECPFCRSIYLKSCDATSKLVVTSNYKNTSGYRGCEQDTLIIHLKDLYSNHRSFETLSRARKNMIMIVDKRSLENKRSPPGLFHKTIKEILKHHETCENQKCKENGWEKLKVIDVEYTGE